MTPKQKLILIAGAVIIVIMTLMLIFSGNTGNDTGVVAPNQAPATEADNTSQHVDVQE